MSYRFALTSLALFTTFGLAGCNASPQPVASATPVAASFVAITPPDLQLPEGASCTSEISRYSTITTNDYNSGNVDPSVYDQIKGEISKASDACRARQDAQAHALLAASKHKHGYPS